MSTIQPFPAGGYRFISHQFQYSGGAAAEPGFRVVRARFARPLPLAEGFDAIEAYLARIGRSPTEFCACELRPPHRHWLRRTQSALCRATGRLGMFHDEINPVARIDPPATSSFYAFSYTVPDENRAMRSFVAAGSGEAREGGPATKGASFGAATSRPRRCARRHALCSRRWSSGWRRSTSAGRM